MIALVVVTLAIVAGIVYLATRRTDESLIGVLLLTVVALFPIIGILYLAGAVS